MSMMIHRKREALRLAEELRKQKSESQPKVVGAEVNDPAPVADHIEEGGDVTPAPAPKRGRKKKV